MKVIRYILFPFVPIYYVITWLRNRCYDTGILSSKSYDVPIVCVGNLSVGGTGKTPMIEYLIRLLKEDNKVATLSRGYGRQTKDYILADQTATADTIGDEPFQFYSKFKEIHVAVDANRQHGISMLLKQKPDVILLDDAFQHRKVKAGLNILLTTFDNLYYNDIVLPTGNLREPRSGAKRADIIVVTKCPIEISEQQKNDIITNLKITSQQSVFFSEIKYSEHIYNSITSRPIDSIKDDAFTLVTGIANADTLVNYFTSNNFNFEHINYKDHHRFSESDIKLLKEKEFIVTTEKDYMRLKGILEDSKLWYLPIETKISNNPHFNQLITSYISN